MDKYCNRSIYDEQSFLKNKQNHKIDLIYKKKPLPYDSELKQVIFCPKCKINTGYFPLKLTFTKIFFFDYNHQIITPYSV